MNQFIIATHATFAGGLADVVRFFKADLENVQFINAYVETQEFEKELRAALEKVKQDNVIVLTDIMGGSVNQVAARLMKEYSYKLVAGVNLPLLLDLVFFEENITEEQIRTSVEAAKQQIIYVNDFLRAEESGGEEEL